MSYSNLTHKVNSIGKNNKKIFIYNNLPSGGASKTLISVTQFLKEWHPINLHGIRYKKSNILIYLKKAIVDNYFYDKRIFRRISKIDLLICFQSWLIKTPYILRFAHPQNTIYICHEPQSEYYDAKIQSIKTIKQKLVDLIRLPIKWIDKSNIKSYSGIIVVNSQYSQKLVKKAYNKKATVIYPCITDLFFHQKIKNNDKKHNLISVGAVNPLKGFDLLIKAISTIKIEIRPSFTIIGNGGKREYILALYKLAKDLGVNLRIKLNISDRELITEYDESLAFLFAPVSEPFGLVVLEAMARGLPVVAYKHGGGYAEILSKNNGFLVDNRIPAEWGKTIEKLINLPKISVRNIKEFNITYSKKFSSKEYSLKLLALFKNI